MPEAWDAIVVGSGPAGSSAGYHLARGGAQVLVLDAKDVLAGRYKPCAGGITARLAQSFPEEVYAPAVERTIDRMRVTSRKNHAFVHQFDGMLFQCTMRANLDRCLLTAAIAAGAKARVGRVVDVRQNGSTTLTLHDGTELQARTVVAADGANSVVARRLGLPHHRRQMIAMEDEAFGQPHADWSQTYEVLLSTRPIGYWWVFPKSDHLSTGFGAPQWQAKEIRRWTMDYTRRHLREPRHSLHGHHIPLRDPEYPALARGVYLVGDAGGFVDPCTGEGISWAALSGRRAAEAILAGDPQQFTTWVHWADGEFTAARAFRNLLIVRLMLRLKSTLCGGRPWYELYDIARGARTYQDWLQRRSALVKAYAWLLNQLAPV